MLIASRDALGTGRIEWLKRFANIQKYFNGKRFVGCLRISHPPLQPSRVKGMVSPPCSRCPSRVQAGFPRRKTGLFDLFTSILLHLCREEWSRTKARHGDLRKRGPFQWEAGIRKGDHLAAPAGLLAFHVFADLLA